jgi:hypothetical protein
MYDMKRLTTALLYDQHRRSEITGQKETNSGSLLGYSQHTALSNRVSQVI